MSINISTYERLIERARILRSLFVKLSEDLAELEVLTAKYRDRLTLKNEEPIDMAIPSSEVLQRTVQQHLDDFHAKRAVVCSAKDSPIVKEECELPEDEAMDFEDPPLFREEAPVFFGESPSTASAIELYSQKFPEPVVKDLNPDAIVERCKERVAAARGKHTFLPPDQDDSPTFYFIEPPIARWFSVVNPCFTMDLTALIGIQVIGLGMVMGEVTSVTKDGEFYEWAAKLHGYHGDVSILEFVPEAKWLKTVNGWECNITHIIARENKDGSNP